MLFAAIAVLFLAACLGARVYRSRIGPFLASRLPSAIAAPLSAGIGKGLTSVEDFSTHELAALLAARIADESARATAKAAAESRLDKLRGILDPASVAAPPPASPDPKP